MRLLIAAGGTGGHIYPALAVARSLSASPEAPELRWLGGHRGLEATLVPAAGIPLRRLAARSLRTTELDIHAVLDPIRLGLSVPQATAILVEERPAAVFTTGGYVAVPVLLAAAPLRIPVVLWDGNVIPGRAVRATARLAAALAVSFEATCRALAAAAPGPAVLRDRHADPRRSRDRPRWRPGCGWTSRPMSASCSSSAGRRPSGASTRRSPRPCPRLVERVTVIHVTGDDGYAAALAGREGLPEAVRRRYRPYPFLRDEMLAALATADLVVGRAGSSTLAEVTALGVPMVVVPYPHAAGHQRANAASLVEAGAARLVDDEAFDADALVDAAELLDDPLAHAGDVGRGARARAARRGRRRGRARPGRRDRGGLPGRREGSSGWRAGRAR